jgi:hypothetical protein
LPEVQEYYDDTLHVFEIIEEIKLMLQTEITKLDKGNAIDDEHRTAWEDQNQKYLPLVAQWNNTNGKANPELFTQGWNIEKGDASVGGGYQAWPRHYMCPLTRKAFKDPVRSPTTGCYYEKNALEDLIQRDGVDAECPRTGKKFTQADQHLPVDIAMKAKVVEFRDQNR